MNVYDFDNTIYDGETLVDFILYYVRTDPRIWRYVPKLLVIAFKDAFHLFTVAQALEAYASFLEGYYVKVEHIEEDVVKFWDSHIHKIKPWYAKVQREDDIIVSGTTDFLLDEVMRRLGVKHYVGSSIDKNTGKFIRLCFLDNKVKIFRELYPNAHIDNFYTDSMNDKIIECLAKNFSYVRFSVDSGSSECTKRCIYRNYWYHRSNGKLFKVWKWTIRNRKHNITNIATTNDINKWNKRNIS